MPCKCRTSLLPCREMSLELSAHIHAFGLAVVISSPKGVSAVLLGNEAEAALRNSFHTIVELDRSPLHRATHAALDGDSDPTSLPLDMQGTEFQERVWRYLQKIPRGGVISYADVARGIGQPTATRAAAQAVGKNRHGIIVPCHRVVRSDGDIGGFRWGIDIKLRLLEIEGIGAPLFPDIRAKAQDAPQGLLKSPEKR
jgi:AraC family transcriptional regulator of adaptative response/methylated-DNA-[protein]-cysteine methyltransferase